MPPHRTATDPIALQHATIRQLWDQLDAVPGVHVRTPRYQELVREIRVAVDRLAVLVKAAAKE